MFDLKGPVAARIAPFAAYILFLVLDRPLSGFVTGLGWDARWLYAAKMALVLSLLALFWRGYSELRMPSAMPPAAWVISMVVGLAVFACWILPYPGWAMLGDPGLGFDPSLYDGSGIDWWLAATRVAGAALVVPLMEELFWRSFLMRWLDRKDFESLDPAKVSLRAFAVTAVLFAVEHSLWLAGLLAGIAFNWLYRKYRNLWVPIVAHAVANGALAVWVLHRGAWQYW